MAALLTGAGGVSVADDGAINNKNMTNSVNLPTFSQDIVNSAVPEAEHAFTEMMKFYVPSQAASGLLTPIVYNNIDDVLVEELVVAKPLVNAFIYGPLFEVEATAFGHSFMDAYASVSLDDGVTFKEVNLSESADLSSFNLDTDHIPSVKDPLPNDHTILLGEDDDSDDEGSDDGESAYHAPGYETPYTSECTECHGVGLQGTAQTPSCYSCHENVWTEDTPIEIGPIVTQAEFDDDQLDIEGENAASRVTVTVINAITGEAIGTDRANRSGEFELELEYQGSELPPCVVLAEYTDVNGIVVKGPAVSVVDEETGLPVEECEGSPLDLTEYPGGVFNVFHSVAKDKVSGSANGNKVLVAWPSRFCESGQPAYTMSPTQETPDTERADAVVGFIQAGSEELGVPALPDFNQEDDLYLVDAFGVAGRQGSIDFADEGYPQAGVVPFGCVWTARGVLLPGDDPRTADVTEASHMVWTKAERLTSGRRDPNRIEVAAVKGAGFVVTWQEDPDGLRPGQGEGPGEGWSGAVAHPQTDVWYSYINEEYFDIVETVDNTTVPIDILDHDLTLSGRPQVFVPMAVPMRLTNNAKCNAPDATGVINDDLYCNYDLAAIYGLKDQCADTITVITGPSTNPTETLICVGDSDGDGTADLPNRANTASTRPRTSLQGYDASTDDLSAWVIVAMEESKGLGKFFFEPDGLDGGGFDGYADPCEEGSSLTCTEEIGKNAWYHSFDMGTPDTSAGIGVPNSLVENLVYQGDLLNQPEVYWETGEWYGLMDTSEMGDGGTSLYGDYDFEIVSTEIARRTSLLAQTIDKALNSQVGLVAIQSWKQGVMRQGGPADTFLRRFVLPDGYGGTEPTVCPIDENVDADQPVVVQAFVRINDAGEPRLRVFVDGLDGLTETPTAFRNAVTATIYDGIRYKNPEATVDERFGFSIDRWGVPCAIQVADFDDSVEWGPWTAVDLSNLPEGYSCDGPIPAECTTTDGIALQAAATTEGIDVNPYGFENMVCETYLIEPATNPYYPKGVCADTPTNLSAVVPDTCLDDDDGSAIPCPTVDFTTSTFGVGDTNPILQGFIQGEGNTMRVLTWHQCPSDGTQTVGDFTAVTCDGDDRLDDFVNLQDQSWYNPLDISKGHRGFLDGDFVQFLYAWSPNWRLNAKGNDRYELYIRRSFTGGEDWTTTPTSFTASDGQSYPGDGTVTCEIYRSDVTQVPNQLPPKVCYQYGAGAAEQARNVTQHKSNNITTLDPRYTPNAGTITDGCTDGLFVDPLVIDGIFTCDDLSVDHDSDLRNPSRYFVVFETGDNNTVADGEAEPLDLMYSRAEGFGDDYVVWTETDTDSANPEECYPTVDYGVLDLGVVVGSGFCNEFDNLNTRSDTHSSEASMTANPDGSKMYAVWAQWVFEGDRDNYDGEIIESDAMARRVWWIDDYVSDTEAYTLPGTQQP
jgi:hypothetical protein